MATERSAPSRCSRASTRSTSSTISGTAASCTSCCGALPPEQGAYSAGWSDADARISVHDWPRTTQAPRARLVMMNATAISGQPVPEHAERREHHREVPEHIVAPPNPRRAHVGVALAERPEQRERDRIGEERDGAHCSHGKGLRHGAGMPGRDAVTQSPKRPMVAPFAKAAHDDKTDDVVSGVAEKVEGIGLKRR